MQITQLTLPAAILYAAVGMAVVMAILSLLALLVQIISKMISAMEKRKAPAEVLATPAYEEPAPAAEAPKATAPPQVAPQVTLIDTDEATAAVLMAIVAERSGIPLNRLAFKSIKLLED